MMVWVKAVQTDDSTFIELLNSLVNGLVADRTSERLWIIQIDNWFDQKWLNFSGYGLADSGIPLDRFDTVKVEKYQDKLTFPPFTPNRVLSQWSYLRTEIGYEESPLRQLPHNTVRRGSGENLQRRVCDFDPSACFIWYSSNTRANGRASVMVYTASSGGCDSWFTSFTRRNGWELDATKGINSNDVALLMKSN